MGLFRGRWRDPFLRSLLRTSQRIPHGAICLPVQGLARLYIMSANRTKTAFVRGTSASVAISIHHINELCQDIQAMVEEKAGNFLHVYTFSNR